jgi:hypothetical protein
VASVRLPSGDYTGLSEVHGQLMLVDYGDSPPHAADGGTCQTAVINPHSLRLSSAVAGACDSPALFHRQVMAIDQSNRSAQIQVRIATSNPRARKAYTLGPALVTYQQCSDCWDVSIYGPRALWIYAPFSTPTGFKAKGKLFRVSERTGRVLKTWPMPSITRPLLAVDADGLWLTSSIDGGGPGVLYHVAPDARAPDPVVKFSTPENPGLPARFLIAAGHTVWFETYLATPGSRPRLWRLYHTNITMRSRQIRGTADCADSGEGPATVLGTARTGFYCVAIGNWQNGQGATTQNVFRVLPDQLEQQQVATVIPPPDTIDVQAAAALNGSYYFLDPKTQRSAGRLFRMTPP